MLLAYALMAVALYSVRADGMLRLQHGRLTFALGGAASLAMLAQTLAPELLATFMRDAPLVRDGEIWRIASANLFHSGGWGHLSLNLIMLLLIGPMAEIEFGRIVCVFIAIVGALAGQISALWLDPFGAGLSFALAGLIGGYMGTLSFQAWRTQLGLLAIAALVLLADPHGIALLAGLLSTIHRPISPGLYK